MADGPASARERAEAGTPIKRVFPHLRPLSDEQRALQHAAAVWVDMRTVSYGRTNLRRHHMDIHGQRAYRFRYTDRVYVLHRDPGDLAAWAVSLWIAPWADAASGLPEDPAHVETVHGEPLVWGKATREQAVLQHARDLYGTECDHGYHRGRDSCPGCDVLDDRYEDLPH